MTEPHTDSQTTGTYTVGPSNVATQLVSAGDYSTLVTNLSLTTIVYLGQHNAIKINDPDVVPLNPNASIVFDGSIDIFGTAAVNTQVAVVASGAASFLGLTQAQGTLVLPSIQSQNYVPGVSGWAIFANGNAEFNGITVRGNIVFSDGWLSNGDGTYTNQPGLFIYSSTPAAGNLIYSNTNATGSDKFNNNFLAGDSTYDNTGKTATSRINGAENFYTFNTQPNASFLLNGLIDTAVDFTSGLAGPGIQVGYEFQITDGTGNTIQIQADGNSHPQVIDNLTKLTSFFGHSLRINGGSILINSTTPITVHSWTNIQPGNYFLRGRIRFTSATGTIQPCLLRIAGNSTFTCAIAVDICQEGANVVYNTGYISTQNADPTVGPNLANSLTYRWEFDGYINVTAAGNLTITMRQGVSSANEQFTVLPASWSRLEFA